MKNRYKRTKNNEEIEKQIDDATITQDEIGRIRWSREAEEAEECYRKEYDSWEYALSQTLARLGFPWVDIYKCTCETRNLTDEELALEEGYTLI